MNVSAADPADSESIESILDAAMLETDPDRTAAAVGDGRAFVAESDERILGAVVCVPRDQGVHVDAIAVRPGRRGQGIGAALLSALTDRFERVTAVCDPDVRPFYEKQGWAIEPLPDTDRLRATYSTSGSTSSRPAESSSETRSSSGPSA